MKAICVICVIALICIVVSYQNNTGQEIKIYSTGRDIRSEVGVMNSWVADRSADSLKFTIVDRESEADVNVSFRNDIGNPNAASISYAYRGHVDVDSSTPAEQLPNLLVHELLHCAGTGHDREDPSSVMYTFTQTQGHLNEEHIRNLKRLSGMTPAQRLVAQFRALF